MIKGLYIASYQVTQSVLCDPERKVKVVCNYNVHPRNSRQWAKSTYAVLTSDWPRIRTRKRQKSKIGFGVLTPFEFWTVTWQYYSLWTRWENVDGPLQWTHELRSLFQRMMLYSFISRPVKRLLVIHIRLIFAHQSDNLIAIKRHKQSCDFKSFRSITRESLVISSLLKRQRATPCLSSDNDHKDHAVLCTMLNFSIFVHVILSVSPSRMRIDNSRFFITCHILCSTGIKRIVLSWMICHNVPAARANGRCPKPVKGLIKKMVGCEPHGKNPVSAFIRDVHLEILRLVWMYIIFHSALITRYNGQIVRIHLSDYVYCSPETRPPDAQM